MCVCAPVNGSPWISHEVRQAACTSQSGASACVCVCVCLSACVHQSVWCLCGNVQNCVSCKLKQQECIPVGCVLPTRYRPGKVFVRGGGRVSVQEGVFVFGGSLCRVSLSGGCLPDREPRYLPPVDRQTPVKT